MDQPPLHIPVAHVSLDGSFPHPQKSFTLIKINFSHALQEVCMLCNQLEVVIIEIEKLLLEHVPVPHSDYPLLQT